MSQPPLLPQDRYLAQLLGLSEDEYRWFCYEVQKGVKIEPGQPIAGTELVLAIISLVIGIGSTVASFLLRPSVPTLRDAKNRPAQLKANQGESQNIASAERYAPLAGFDSVQNTTTLGSIVPLVYAKQTGAYGGVRVNMPLLWSQMLSKNGGMRFKGLFLLGEGLIESLDEKGFAIGNNGLGFYEAQGDNARFSIYYKANGGRPSSADRISGALTANDPMILNSSDILEVATGKHFVGAYKPSTQTTFGVYTLIGNNLMYRVNPTVRPKVNANLVPKGVEGDAKVKCELDYAVVNQRLKQGAKFPSYSGITSDGTGSVNGLTQYNLYRAGPALTEFDKATDLISTNPADWTITKEVKRNPFTTADDTRVKGWLNRTLTINTDGSGDPDSLTISFTLDESAITSWFGTTESDRADDEGIGSHQIKYKVFVAYTQGDLELDYEFEFNPIVKIKGKGSGGGTSGGVLPSLTTDADGNVTSWDPGVLPSGSGVTTTYAVRFRKSSKSYTKNFSRQLPEPLGNKDVAAAISARQKTWDDAIRVGDLYKVGSALAICTNRTPAPFISDSDNEPPTALSGVDVVAQFTTIETGSVDSYTTAQLTFDATNSTQVSANESALKNATTGHHIYRIAVGQIKTQRRCNVVQIGIRSAIGVSINGLCNLKDALTYEVADAKACKDKQGKIVPKGETLRVNIFNSSQLSASEPRYSFFKLGYREAGSSGGFTELAQYIGVSGIGRQTIYNTLRIAMPSTKQWEYRFMPVTGREARIAVGGATFYVMDAKSTSSASFGDGTITVSITGRQITDPAKDFKLNTTEVPVDIGMGHVEGFNYADSYGRLAEAFVYDEISSSPQDGPEHEISFVSETVENASVPLYNNLAMIAMTMAASSEWTQLSQFSAYVTGGRKVYNYINGDTAASNLFPDILGDIMLNSRFGTGDQISAAQIDSASFKTAAEFCRDQGYYYDGVISEKQNLRGWAADVAATMLLDFMQVNGKFRLEPAVIFSGPVPISGLFTAGNIIENSFQLQWLDEEDRLPIQVSVKWRRERALTGYASPASFAEPREVLVRRTEDDESTPIESFDLSSYCTNETHAIDFAKFVIRTRTLPTHSIKFQTTPQGLVGRIEVGSYIQVAMDSTHYNAFANGIVLQDGSLVTSNPEALAPGTHTVKGWTGRTGDPVADTELIVSGDGKTASPTGIVFSKLITDSQLRTYKIEQVSIDQEGIIDIEAVHHPTDASGVSEIGKNWFTGWTILKS